MFIEDFKNNDYIVINNGSKIKNGKVISVEGFLNEAESDAGLDIEGNLYCYIPDFEQDIYSVIKEAVDDSKWFVFNKSEIPSWFKADEAMVIRSANEDEPPRKAPEKKKKKSMFSNKEEVTTNNTNDDDDEYSMTEGLSAALDPNANESAFIGVKSLFENSQEDSIESGNKEAKIYVFGSSKGGTGKTFTCLISAYRYAKTHPGEKIAVVDFDIIDGQVGISILQIQPTMMSYWRSYISGDNSFKTMKEFSTKSPNFPQNIDFYLAPKDYYINDKKFWLSIIDNLVKNYDTVFFDTGIDYINYPPIAFAYKIADRIVLTSTTSIKSVSSVLKQISKLKGLSSSANARGDEVFKADDEIGPKLRLAITGYNKDDPTNKTVIETFSKNIKINAIFGQYYSDISKAEYYGEWSIFDDNKKFNQSLDKLVDLSE